MHQETVWLEKTEPSSPPTTAVPVGRPGPGAAPAWWPKPCHPSRGQSGYEDAAPKPRSSRVWGQGPPAGTSPGRRPAGRRQATL